MRDQMRSNNRDGENKIISCGRHFQSHVYLQAMRSNLYTFNLETIDLVMTNDN